MKELKVIKIGGNVIDNPQALAIFLQDFAQIEGPKVLIHGGGALASKMAKDMGLEVQMAQGRRITDAETLKLITMVYAGSINKNIVAQLQAKGCNAIGLSGADGNTIIATKRPAHPIDYGFVGDVVSVHTEVLKLLINQNISPVFCAITHDTKGQLLNTNADTVAAELAIALSKDYQVSLYYCFEKKGILRNIEDEDSVITHINTEVYKQLLADNIIAGGMLPKTTNCFNAINKGVSSVYIGLPSMIVNPNLPVTILKK